MKKLFVLFLAMIMVVACVSCGAEEKSEGVMTFAEYDAAAIDSEVTIEAYVQAHQSWWDNKITVYAADKEGAYFLYKI